MFVVTVSSELARFLKDDRTWTHWRECFHHTYEKAYEYAKEFVKSECTRLYLSSE